MSSIVQVLTHSPNEKKRKQTYLEFYSRNGVLSIANAHNYPEHMITSLLNERFFTSDKLKIKALYDMQLYDPSFSECILQYDNYF